MPISIETREFTYLFPTAITQDGGALQLRWADGDSAFSGTRNLEINPTLGAVLCRRNAFKAEELRAIVDMGEKLPRVDGRAELRPDSYRVSHIAPIAPDGTNEWLFHKLALLFAEVNREYALNLTGFVEPLQYTMYGPAQYFEWHIDVGTGSSSARKLSMTLQLSMPDEYDGGDLEFAGAAIGPEARERGAATFFPSYLGHRVTPVGRGLRRSLVAWAYGPAFR